MKILYVSAEVSPFAKVGGLADVAGSLPIALQRLGHDVKIAMPAYQMVLDDPRWSCRLVATGEVRVGPGWKEPVRIYETDWRGVPVLLIGADRWFTEATSSDRVYRPGVEQYLFFSRAITDLPRLLGWRPEVVHNNDWHTGFVPVLLRENSDPEWNLSACVFTVHNLAYQGCFPAEILDWVGLPRRLYNMHQLEAWGSVNFLKAGCVFSDQVNTVSERYAQEIQSDGFGCGLDGVMRLLGEHGVLSGILNGIDTEVFDPANDPAIPAPFSADDPSGKQVCRTELLQELGMEPIEGAPVMGVVSRLSEQKGMDLMLHAADSMFALPTQMVVLGIGDPWLASEFTALQKRYPRHFRFVERFDVDLAQRIYAGSDAFLMPSSFEPCGLGQMIALRYGTIPIVRETGGLADTVFEGINGFSFAPRTTEGLAETVARMQRAYNDPTTWALLMRTAMQGDYGWETSARKYVGLYRRALAARKGAPTLTAV